MKRLKVAIVAPSTRAPGGQAVQAARLLDAWREDPDIEARLISVNPEPPRFLEPIERIRYVRQLVAMNMFLPQLVTQVAAADVVHVFGAAYRAFLLGAPSRVDLGAHARRAGRAELSQRRGARPLRAIGAGEDRDPASESRRCTIEVSRRSVRRVWGLRHPHRQHHRPQPFLCSANGATSGRA